MVDLVLEGKMFFRARLRIRHTETCILLGYRVCKRLDWWLGGSACIGVFVLKISEWWLDC